MGGCEAVLGEGGCPRGGTEAVLWEGGKRVHLMPIMGNILQLLHFASCFTETQTTDKDTQDSMNRIHRKETIAWIFHMEYLKSVL